MFAEVCNAKQKTLSPRKPDKYPWRGRRESSSKTSFGEHYQGQGEPASHAQAILGRGDWIPAVIDPRVWAVRRSTGGR
jgi:hypothetical protein